jgi:archaemetzincin
MEPLPDDLMASMGDSLREAFSVDVVHDEPLDAPDYALDAKRNQYSAPLILQRLVSSPPPAGDRLLAITGRDLYIPMLTFVYGQAQLNGALALVSLARLRPQFYSLPPDPALLDTRVRKEAIHEIGHTFGLVHCPDTSCAMSHSTNIRQLDLKRPLLCAGCALAAREQPSFALYSPTRPVVPEGTSEPRRFPFGMRRKPV